jgi:hypothetical protein
LRPILYPKRGGKPSPYFTVPSENLNKVNFF